MKSKIVLFLSIVLLVILIILGVFLVKKHFIPNIKEENDKKVEFDVRYQEKIKKRIKEVNYCENEFDCLVIETNCPFGCYVAVNKDYVNEISNLLNNFSSNCTYRCMRNYGVSCQNNTCKVNFSPLEED